MVLLSAHLKRQTRTETYRNGKKRTITDSDGQKWTETDRSGQKQTDTDRNGQKFTESERSGQDQTETDKTERTGLKRRETYINTLGFFSQSYSNICLGEYP